MEEKKLPSFNQESHQTFEQLMPESKLVGEV